MHDLQKEPSTLHPLPSVRTCISYVSVGAPTSPCLCCLSATLTAGWHRASEREIRAGYKRKALEWHPDRWMDKTSAERDRAEATFKEVQAALELLTDTNACVFEETARGLVGCTKRKLWDAGFDLVTIQSREQQMKGMQSGGGGGGGGGG